MGNNLLCPVPSYTCCRALIARHIGSIHTYTNSPLEWSTPLSISYQDLFPAITTASRTEPVATGSKRTNLPAAMDITMLPPSAILSHHSHQVYHSGPPAPPAPTPALLPSALPRRVGRYTPSFSYTPCPHHAPGMSTYRYTPRPKYEPTPPTGTRCPIMELPDELWLEMLKFMDWEDLLRVRGVNRRLAGLALSPALHHSLTLTSLPPMPIPEIMARHLLPPVRHLQLHLFPYPSPSAAIHPSLAIQALIEAIPADQLVSLSLPFSAPYLSSTELGTILRHKGGKLEKLDLRGSGVAGRSCLDWITHIGKQAAGGGLRELDLGFTNITELPTLASPKANVAGPGPFNRLPTPPPDNARPDSDSVPPIPAHLPFTNLRTLSLASCTSISPSSLLTFLRDLPPSLEVLDISRLEQTSFEALWGMKVVHNGEPTALREIKVVGIDHLTRLDIRRLKRHWETQRRACDTIYNYAFDPEPPIELKARRVWGEPKTPELVPSSSVTPPMSIPHPTPAQVQARQRRNSPILLTPPDNDLELSPPQPTSYDDKHPFLLSPPSITTYHRMDRPSTPCPVPAPAAKDAVSINILHSAILESEDEAGYRQFIGEVAGGTVGLGFVEWENTL